MSSAPRLVVRTYAPLRRLLLVGGGVALVLFGLFIAFEWGRSNAGFDGRAARIERGELNDRIDELQDEIRRNRLQIAAYETERVGQTRERAELAKTIGGLQADVARLTSDLAFYRGVVGDRASGDVLKIQEFRVTRGAAENQYQLRLVLARPLRLEDSLAGKVRMTFEGTTAATPVNLDLSAVADVPGGELAFSYRYVQTLEQTIQLPAGFTPARTTIEVIPSRKGVNPVRETVIWTVQN